MYHLLLLLLPEFLVGTVMFWNFQVILTVIYVSYLTWLPFLLHCIYWPPLISFALSCFPICRVVVCISFLFKTIIIGVAKKSRSSCMFAMPFHCMGAFWQPSILCAVDLWICCLRLVRPLRPFRIFCPVVASPSLSSDFYYGSLTVAFFFHVGHSCLCLWVNLLNDITGGCRNLLLLLCFIFCTSIYRLPCFQLWMPPTVSIILVEVLLCLCPRLI